MAKKLDYSSAKKAQKVSEEASAQRAARGVVRSFDDEPKRVVRVSTKTVNMRMFNLKRVRMLYVFELECGHSVNFARMPHEKHEYLLCSRCHSDSLTPGM